MEDSFHCPKCLEEQRAMITTQGYGYGYIGKSWDCHRHPQQTQSPQPTFPFLTNPGKWRDGLPAERSARIDKSFMVALFHGQPYK